MKLSKLNVIAVTGFGCVALLGASYFMPAESAGPAPEADPNAGSQNARAPLDKVELVSVPGSDVKYPSRIESTIGDKPVRLALTGVAVRKKVIVNVYTVASYAQEGVAIASADDLCSKDCVKQLHLVMQTGVSGKQMIEAFTEGVRKNHAKPQFEADIAALGEKLRTLDLVKGDNVWLTYIPGVGLKADVVGKLSVAVENVAFAKAMWEIYLGKKNLGEQVKSGLASRLK
ncbi:MAG: chalcone isomerase family protein [Gemmataceae bacterium]